MNIDVIYVVFKIKTSKLFIIFKSHKTSNFKFLKYEYISLGFAQSKIEKSPSYKIFTNYYIFTKYSNRVYFRQKLLKL